MRRLEALQDQGGTGSAQGKQILMRINIGNDQGSVMISTDPGSVAVHTS